MLGTGETNRVKEFLGSAHVFASAVNNVIDQKLLRDSVGSQLTVEQMRLLKLVSLREAHTIGDVAAFLEISKAAASKTVDKLVRRALLRRTESEMDRRSIELSLTEASRRLLALYEAERERKLAEIFGEALPEDLRHMSEFLDRLSIRIVKNDSRPEKICLQCGIYFRENCSLRNALNRKCFHEQRQVRKTEEVQSTGGGARIRFE